METVADLIFLVSKITVDSDCSHEIKRHSLLERKALRDLCLFLCLLTKLCLTLCDPIDCSLPCSSVHGIFQVKVLEWVAFHSPGDLPNSGIEPGSPALQAEPSEPRRKSMTNLDNILKSRDVTLPTKVYIVKAMVFPVVVYGCESWIIKKAECLRTDASELWCWARLLRVPGQDSRLQGDQTSQS